MSSVKTCFKCGVEKPLNDFYRHPQMGDGRLGKCKECNKRDVAENYAKRRGQYAAYEKRRYQEPERRAAVHAGFKLHAIRHPDRYRARVAVGNAVRDGRLVRGPCEFPGCTSKTEAHHDDYSRPLDVHWMCRKHHLAEHGKVAYSI